MPDIKELVKEFLTAFNVKELYQISEPDFYRALGERFKIWRSEYNAMVGLWSESVNARRRTNNGLL